MSDNERYVYLYDTTLRDGAQGCGVNLGLEDKIALASAIDSLGIDYIEAGWPGANPVDDAFFARRPHVQAKVMSFGMTRRPGGSVYADKSLRSVLAAGSDGVCLVGKASDFHVRNILRCSLDENLAMISESIVLAKEKTRKNYVVMFDAEHFFDGYKSDMVYTLSCLGAALRGGADWLVLCDTNGGTLPGEVHDIVSEVRREFPNAHLGIHCHNDTENAVANSLAALEAGARQVQGTMNGLGERCGNTNLIALMASLYFKTDWNVRADSSALRRLRKVSLMLGERLNMSISPGAAYVGDNAFAHKGGLHVMAVLRDPASYEHIDPQKTGAKRRLLTSDQAGQATILAQLERLGYRYEKGDRKILELLRIVKEREFAGYAYESAEASFDLLVRHFLGKERKFFEVLRFRVIDERRFNAKGEQTTESEATVRLRVVPQKGTDAHCTDASPRNENIMHEVATGNGPVNALDNALRKALLPWYPVLQEVRLIDYKVRILTPEKATAATPRVTIESTDNQGLRWTTVGVSSNVVAASFHALQEAYIWRILYASTADRQERIHQESSVA